MARKLKKKPTIKNKVGARNSGVLIGTIAIGAIMLFGVLVVVAQKMMATEVYYQVTQDVLPRQTITANMVEDISTKKGTAPATAITLSDIQSGAAQAKYALSPGEVLTYGNVGAAGDSLHDNLLHEKEKDLAAILEKDGNPEDYENWVLTSFSVGADSAIGGRITPGSYFDMMVIDSTGAYYPFINLRAIDTTVSLSGASSSNAANTEEAYAGQTSQYVVQLSPNDAARLQWFVSNFGNSVKLVLNDKSDVKSDGTENTPVAEGANKYGGFDSTTEGEYEGIRVVSPNLNANIDNTTREDAAERLRESASDQARRLQDSRAEAQVEEDTSNEETTSSEE